MVATQADIPQPMSLSSTELGSIIECHLTLTIISMPFHNINYTILTLAITQYLDYDPLMDINAPTSAQSMPKRRHLDDFPPLERCEGIPCQVCLVLFKHCTYDVYTIGDVI